ncbi:hypothetical protein [Candidatus Hodgkinia cicadicola]|uniref:hypothetical protein n=1 Tax=Candidatus Hodgkinia cicadicola TaxID=573658 RepID=UPI002414DA67
MVTSIIILKTDMFSLDVWSNRHNTDTIYILELKPKHRMLTQKQKKHTCSNWIFNSKIIPPTSILLISILYNY